MAKKKEEPKLELERTYNVPLRKEWLKVPKYKRAKKAARALREFLARHMKSDNVKIGLYANKELWKRGIKSPPHHIKVIAKKDSEGIVTAELVGAPEEKKEKVKKEATAKKELEEAEKMKELSGLEKKAEEAKKDNMLQDTEKEVKDALGEEAENNLSEKPKKPVKKSLPKL